MSVRSEMHGMVEDLQLGSSPASTSTPPDGWAPHMLPWRSGSPARSTPGALPYQTPTTPSTLRPWPGTSTWLPHTAVAASSSLTAGTSVRPAFSCSSVARARVWSSPPSGLPW